MLTSTWGLTVDPRALGLSFMRPLTTLATQSNSSMGTTGTVAFSRSAWIASPTLWEAVASADVEALVAVAASAEASPAVADSEVVVDSAVAMEGGVAMVEVQEVPRALDTVQPRSLLWPLLRTRSPTLLLPTVREARSSTSAT